MPEYPQPTHLGPEPDSEGSEQATDRLFGFCSQGADHRHAMVPLFGLQETAVRNPRGSYPGGEACTKQDLKKSKRDAARIQISSGSASADLRGPSAAREEP